MLEYIIQKTSIKIPKKYKFLFYISLFFWNLVIYSLPLFLASYYYIKIPFIQDFTQNIIFFILNILNTPDIKIKYPFLILDDNTYIYIGYDCSGYKTILGFFAIIFATPFVEFKEKVVFFLIGAVILYILNILRILSILLLYKYISIEFIHDTLWQILNSIILVSLWYIFFEKNISTIKKKISNFLM